MKNQKLSLTRDNIEITLQSIKNNYKPFYNSFAISGNDRKPYVLNETADFLSALRLISYEYGKEAVEQYMHSFNDLNAELIESYVVRDFYRAAIINLVWVSGFDDFEMLDLMLLKFFESSKDTFDDINRFEDDFAIFMHISNFFNPDMFSWLTQKLTGFEKMHGINYLSVFEKYISNQKSSFFTVLDNQSYQTYKNRLSKPNRNLLENAFYIQEYEVIEDACKLSLDEQVELLVECLEVDDSWAGLLFLLSSNIIVNLYENRMNESLDKIFSMMSSKDIFVILSIYEGYIPNKYIINAFHDLVDDALYFAKQNSKDCKAYSIHRAYSISANINTINKLIIDFEKKENRNLEDNELLSTLIRSYLDSWKLFDITGLTINNTERLDLASKPCLLKVVMQDRNSIYSTELFGGIDNTISIINGIIDSELDKLINNKLSLLELVKLINIKNIVFSDGNSLDLDSNNELRKKKDIIKYETTLHLSKGLKSIEIDSCEVLKEYMCSYVTGLEKLDLQDDSENFSEFCL